MNKRIKAMRKRLGPKCMPFPLGLVCLGLTAVVSIVILIGASMLTDPTSEAEAQTVEVAEPGEKVSCSRYSDLKEVKLDTARRCVREVDGEFSDLTEFDLYLEQCEGLDMVKHQQFTHKLGMWRTRCEYTDTAYMTALSLASELPTQEDAKAAKLVLIQEFYVNYLRGRAELTEGSDFTERYPMEDYIARDVMIGQLTSAHTEPLNERTVEFLKISEQERYEILTDRFMRTKIDWLDNLTSKHIAAGYDETRVYDIYMDAMIERGQLQKAREVCFDYLDGNGVERIEEARIEDLMRKGEYIIVMRPDGTPERQFPMNNTVQINE